MSKFNVNYRVILRSDLPAREAALMSLMVSGRSDLVPVSFLA
jgi:hypothetical protein